MSAARRGAIAATVLLVGLVALLLSPATTRAVVQPTASSVPEATSTPKPTPTPCPTSLLTHQCLPGTPTSTPFPISTTTTTTITTTSTLTYAVLPGSATIPPTATPKPPPTPTPSPPAFTDTGTSALGTDTTSVSSQATQASTVINPQPGGDSSSVLPLTVLAFLVLIGGGAVFVVTRLR
jgi:hypothetical protein